MSPNHTLPASSVAKRSTLYAPALAVLADCFHYRKNSYTVWNAFTMR